MSIDRSNNSKIYTVCKRSIDLVISIIGLIIVSPLFLFIGFFYLFGENKGPLIFKQNRVGKGGELFYIYKFRSMIVDADEKLKANKVLYQKYLKNNYKLEPEEDPRITKLGRFLRKTSLDEIPQLINVIKGDMSLVGPRPVVEEELLEYGERKNEFLSVKPGITGYWQVSGRSNVGYPERVNLELYYVNNQSLLFDLYIFLKTIFMVILKKGAY
ncbi:MULTISPECIES: sugar transferase [Heyndrickxia]|uniref:sugar transferase n=1 Tax=Heyndrickxia TaxID=2837504 RepID=UPI002E226A97|nr:sugar transferase [Weizmannia sp. CD-2023]MED4890497.1 sugar transferase [Weizmannia sp. CD-2023]MED4921644.1 sugar transferase [Weizmannia sp. CD-2023]